MIEEFTSLQSLVLAFADAVNLVEPDAVDHHERVAYLSYRIAEEARLDANDRLFALFGAVLHDVGAIVTGEDADAMWSGWVTGGRLPSATPLRQALPVTHGFAMIAESAQFLGGVAKHYPLPKNPVLIGHVVHVADIAATMLEDDRHALNQVEGIRRAVLDSSEARFMPKAIEAFERVCEKEFVWMDLLHNPKSFADFVPAERYVTLDEAVHFTKFMSLIIDFRSPFTAMHSAGVAASAVRLAQLSGMSEDECKMMRIAGNLHDIGKLATPRAILEKPGKLTREERDVIKEHAYFTYMLLRKVDGFGQISAWAAFHHEKLDGSGYPFKLVEPQIPLGSRIMAVADIFSALTEERPYRASMPKEKVIAILREDADNGLLSKQVVDLLVSNFDDVNACRDADAREMGKRYFDSLE